MRGDDSAAGGWCGCGWWLVAGMVGKSDSVSISQRVCVCVGVGRGCWLGAGGQCSLISIRNNISASQHHHQHQRSSTECTVCSVHSRRRNVTLNTQCSGCIAGCSTAALAHWRTGCRPAAAAGRGRTQSYSYDLYDSVRLRLRAASRECDCASVPSSSQARGSRARASIERALVVGAGYRAMAMVGLAFMRALVLYK